MQSLSIIAVVLSLAAACTPPTPPTPAGGDLRPSVAEPKSPLYVLYPHLDQRIVAFALPEGGDEARRLARYFPDLWNAQITAIRDFAVDRERLYALASSRDATDDPHLYTVSLKSGSLEKKVKLDPSPQRLRWASRGRLLVGHATSRTGPPGRLSVVDTRSLARGRSIALRGSCIDLVSFGERAFVIERSERLIGANDVFATFQLVAIDLARGEVLRRRPIPPGARQLNIGPTGLLYVSHVSGSGLHSTDATVSVFSPQNFDRVDRLPFEMSARAMTSDQQLLVTSLLKSNGDAWFNATATDHSTVFDFRLSELVTHQLVLVDGVAYIPLRQQNALERVDLRRPARLPRLSLGGQAHRDGTGLIRVRMRAASTTEARGAR